MGIKKKTISQTNIKTGIQINESHNPKKSVTMFNYRSSSKPVEEIGGTFDKQS